jgi:hypothetical protein
LATYAYPDEDLELPTLYHRLAVGLKFHALQQAVDVVRRHIIRPMS